MPYPPEATIGCYWTTPICAAGTDSCCRKRFLLALLVDVALQRQLAFPLCLRTAVLDELLGFERGVLLARAGARFEDVVVA